MADVRLIEANLAINFDQVSAKKSEFLGEFDLFGRENCDEISQWIRHAKARGKTENTDEILLKLLLELHHKIDCIADMLEHKEKNSLNLSQSDEIIAIGYGYFKISAPKFTPKFSYYARIFLPVFPKRQIAIFFDAVDENLAKITKMHYNDEIDWDSYVSQKEREKLRKMRGFDD